MGVKCKLQVRAASRYFTITEAAQTFTKLLRLEIISGLMLALVKVWVVLALVKK